MDRPRILIVAGEASGDAHAAGVVRALRESGLEADFFGIGGPRLASEGMHMLANASELAVVGIAEVLERLPKILALLRRIRSEIDRRPPDLFLPVDSPDFNFRLLSKASARGVPVVYFIAPQLWAWRASRVRTLRERVRELLVLFPFEEPWFRERGVPATYVGNPLADEARARAARRAQEHSSPGDAHGAASLDDLSRATAHDGRPAPYGLFLPGSRLVEIRHHLPVFAQTARRLRARGITLRWLVRRAPGIDPGIYARHLERGLLDASDEPLAGLAEQARIVVSASGTASLEAALTGTPLIVVYRMNPLTYQLVRRQVRVPHIAMANLTAGRRIVPEFVQDECAPERLAGEIERLQVEGPARSEMIRALNELRASFGPPGAYARAAERVRAHLP